MITPDDVRDTRNHENAAAEAEAARALPAGPWHATPTQYICDANGRAFASVWVTDDRCVEAGFDYVTAPTEATAAFLAASWSVRDHVLAALERLEHPGTPVSWADISEAVTQLNAARRLMEGGQ